MANHVFGNQSDPVEPVKTGMPLGVKLLIAVLGIITLLFLASKASAQTVPVSPDSPHPCSITEGQKGGAKDFINALCDSATVSVTAQTDAIKLNGKVAEWNAKDKRKQLPTVLITKTTIAADGTKTVEQYEATKDGANHELSMRKEDRKENVGVEKAKAQAAARYYYEMMYGNQGGGYVQAYREPLNRRRRW